MVFAFSCPFPALLLCRHPQIMSPLAKWHRAIPGCAFKGIFLTIFILHCLGLTERFELFGEFFFLFVSLPRKRFSRYEGVGQCVHRIE